MSHGESQFYFPLTSRLCNGPNLEHRLSECELLRPEVVQEHKVRRVGAEKYASQAQA